MKKSIGWFLVLTFLCFVCPECTKTAWAAQSQMSRAQYRKNLAYNKNALPAGWSTEMGYTLWRMNRGLAVNRHTYKRYRREAAKQRHNLNFTERILLDSTNWTNEEIALFLRENRDLFQFHPAGLEE